MEPSRAGVRELARADPVTTLGQLDRLRDCGVRGYAAHVEQLVRAESQQIAQVRVDAGETAAHAIGQQGVQPAPSAQHTIDELAREATIARIETRRRAIESRVE